MGTDTQIEGVRQWPEVTGRARARFHTAASSARIGPAF
jgi:hypothetical protein